MKKNYNLNYFVGSSKILQSFTVAHWKAECAQQSFMNNFAFIAMRNFLYQDEVERVSFDFHINRLENRVYAKDSAKTLAKITGKDVLKPLYKLVDDISERKGNTFAIMPLGDKGIDLSPIGPIFVLEFSKTPTGGLIEINYVNGTRDTVEVTISNKKRWVPKRDPITNLTSYEEDNGDPSLVIEFNRDVA